MTSIAPPSATNGATNGVRPLVLHFRQFACRRDAGATKPARRRDAGATVIPDWRPIENPPQPLNKKNPGCRLAPRTMLTRLVSAGNYSHSHSHSHLPSPASLKPSLSQIG